jgi:hypothetical protein
LPKDTLALRMPDLLRALVYSWTLPNTLLGMLLGAASLQRPRRVQGLYVFDGPVRGSLWVIGRIFRRTAVTYGHVVLSCRPLVGRLLLHEIHHVRQYERLGPLYIPLYLLIFAFTGYRRHPFEEAARFAELAGQAS